MSFTLAGARDSSLLWGRLGRAPPKAAPGTPLRVKGEMDVPSCWNFLEPPLCQLLNEDAVLSSGGSVSGRR